MNVWRLPFLTLCARFNWPACVKSLFFSHIIFTLFLVPHCVVLKLCSKWCSNDFNEIPSLLWFRVYSFKLQICYQFKRKLTLREQNTTLYTVYVHRGKLKINVTEQMRCRNFLSDSHKIYSRDVTLCMCAVYCVLCTVHRATSHNFRSQTKRISM